MIPAITVFIVWDNFADYHHARLASAQQVLAAQGIRLLGVELVHGMNSHAWAKNTVLPDTLVVAERKPTGFSGWLGFVRALIHLQTKHQASALFLPSYWPARPFAALVVSKLLGVPVVMMNESHAGSSQAQSWTVMMKKMLPILFQAAFVAGTPHRRHFARLGFPPKKISLGYSMIDGQAFRRRMADETFLEACARKFKVPARCFLSLGRLVSKKNIPLVVEAYSRLLDGRKEGLPPLVIVGEGEEKEAIFSRVRALGVELWQFEPGADFSSKVDGVCWYPFCANAESTYFYRQASVFILASLHEEWGLVVNEALASGTPVLVSNTVGAAEDLVDSGVNGFCFDPRRAEELAALLTNLVRNTALLGTLKAGAEASLLKVDIINFARGAESALRSVNLPNPTAVI